MSFPKQPLEDFRPENQKFHSWRGEQRKQPQNPKSNNSTWTLKRGRNKFKKIEKSIQIKTVETLQD